MLNRLFINQANKNIHRVNSVKKYSTSNKKKNENRNMTNTTKTFLAAVLFAPLLFIFNRQMNLVPEIDSMGEQIDEQTNRTYNGTESIPIIT